MADIEGNIDRLLLYRHEQPVLQKIAKKKLPEEFLPWVEEYEKIGTRKRFLWQWLDTCTRLTQLPNVPIELVETITLAKSLVNMLNVVTDDMADEERNGALISALLPVLFRKGPLTPTDEKDGYAARSAELDDVPMSPVDRTKASFCLRLLVAFKSTCQKLPRWEDLQWVLRYDCMQMINEKCRSAMINSDPTLLNEVEHWLYAPHTMNGMIFCTIDVMATEGIPREDFGALRGAFWRANVMANIANCLATWRREVPVKDFTSAIFSLALSEGVLRLRDLKDMDPAAIQESIEKSGLERKLVAEWLKNFNAILDAASLAEGVQRVDLKAFAAQNEEFLKMHLACSKFL